MAVTAATVQRGRRLKSETSVRVWVGRLDVSINMTYIAMVHGNMACQVPLGGKELGIFTERAAKGGKGGHGIKERNSKGNKIMEEKKLMVEKWET